jgi:hypothetical protein
MTSRVYKTSQGQTIDLGALILKNEKVRAVGNMKVNARGDSLDGENKSIDTKSRQLKRSNDRQVITNVSSKPITTKNTPKVAPTRDRDSETQ